MCAGINTKYYNNQNQSLVKSSPQMLGNGRIANA